MTNTTQSFLADSTKTAVVELETALLRIPEEKRNWSPSESSRSAIDMVAECALMNATTIGMINTRKFPENFDMAEYGRQRKALCEDWSTLQPLLHENTEKVVEAISAFPSGELSQEIQMPWGPMTMRDVLAYPYWNMSYHLGQINYIASILGCLG